MNDFLPLARKVTKNWVWEDKPFSRGAAWVDLLLLANYTDKKKSKNGGICTYKRGDVNLSMVHLADRWGWDRRKVKRFLNALESDGMVQVNSTTYGTTITIVNYEFYNNGGTTNGTTYSTSDSTTNGTRNSTTESTTDAQIIVQQAHITNKEEESKKENKEKKNIYGVYKHVRLKSSEREELAGRYGEEMTDKCITFLDEYIEMKGYKAKSHYLCIKKWVVDAVKERDRKKGSSKNQFNNYQQSTSNQTVSEFEDLFMREANGG